MTTAWLIATDEWRLIRRNRVAVLGIVMLLALSTIAALTSIAQRDASAKLRERLQSFADRQFDHQPARHPHRMVHYGHFVFRPTPPLAAFDAGIEAFTGNTLFLEGHRQNSANFSDARQSSLLLRFGQLTPAFVMQALAPLLLVFVGFGVVARELGSGTLCQMFALGVSARMLLFGKLLALGAVATLLILPCALALLWMTQRCNADAASSLLLLGGYAIYLALWAILIVFASTLSAHARTALAILIALWAFTAILLPRVATDLALAIHPLPTRLETEIAISADLRHLGDSHNPSDPHFNSFRESVLRRYGVSKVEDLPVNYQGLLAVESETLTSKLFEKYAKRTAAAEGRQSALARWIGVVSPTAALRHFSMTVSRTGASEYRRFLTASEAYRFTMVQRLNQLQADAITYSDDKNRHSDPAASRRVRIDSRHWREIPDFRFTAATTGQALREAWPGLLTLVVSLFLLGAMTPLVARRLREVT